MIKLPSHIAIIMDGNGRWAKKRYLPRVAGHKKGVETVRRIVEYCVKLGIDYLTLYAFSTENWKRPADEVSSLMKLFVETLEKELPLFYEHNIRLLLIGSREGLPVDVLEKMEYAENSTKNATGLSLIVALNYSGRTEILHAVKKIVLDGVAPEEITEELFKKYLYTKEIPDPDLIIRTSGEYRISNYLLWQIAYSEFYFTDVLWPDFKESDLDKAIEAYGKRERRFGGV